MGGGVAGGYARPFTASADTVEFVRADFVSSYNVFVVNGKRCRCKDKPPQKGWYGTAVLVKSLHLTSCQLVHTSDSTFTSRK